MTRLTQQAAVYVRVSSDQQGRNYSLATQEAACREYAAAQGYEIDEQHIYRETHTAAELYERPELSRLREAMGRGEFEALVCYDPDRFSRNQVHTALLQHFCDRADVTLRFALFDFERSATGQFLLNARAFAAELELEPIPFR
jgi:site-specific DNA recombinase